MTPGQKSNARQVSSLGETPAEARRRMQSSGGAAAPSSETTSAPAAVGPPSPRHIAAMREQEGFGGGPSEESTVEEASDLTEPPTPSKAMETIRQLSQDKNQAITERDAALQLVERYRNKYGDLEL